MLIVFSLCALLVWIIFNVQIPPWTGMWKTVAYSVALLIVLVVIGALNYLTPMARVSVQGETI